MASDPLLQPADLAAGLANGTCLAVDCRFDLSGPGRGREAYLAGHIPGARYADLDEDLSAPVTPATGRHPLPPPDAFATFLARIGWDGSRLLVAYDERNNAIAVRLWWLMRYFGQQAGLLDGGLEAWVQSGGALEPGMPVTTPTARPALEANPGMIASADDLLATGPHWILLDARAPERYSGEVEPLDSRAGHIPGALNRPLGRNLDASGRFKSPQELRREFGELAGDAPPSRLVHYCGSGVTACHNQFAMERAGLSGARVYPGSWSEWIRDAGRPVATGRG